MTWGGDLMPYVVGVAVVYGVFWAIRRARQTSPKQARLLVDTGALLLDVRTPAEFEAGHLPGAINLPLPKLTANPAAVGDPQRPVVVYCASGTRSAVASTVLRRVGFAQVADLGSMSRW